MKKLKKVGCFIVIAMICSIFSGILGEKVKAAVPSVEYQAHIANEGWGSYQKDGATAGSTGKSLSLQALKIRLKGISGGITYQTHLSNVGWTSWVSDDKQTGTTGQNRSIEAIKIMLTGNAAQQYDVYYRVHVGGIGWLGWAKNGSEAGSTGCSLQLEAIQIRVLTKNNGIKTSQSSIVKPSITVQSHIGGVGWQKPVAENVISGTTGQSKRMEAMIIQCSDFLGGSGIQYRSHVQNIGWMDWCNSGVCSGTTGRSLQMEAVQIRLSGQISNIFDVYYRVHCDSYGWLGWARNGESAGTTGGSIRMEAIQVKLVRKGTNISREGSAYLSLNGSTALHSPVPSGCKFNTKTTDGSWYGYHDINIGVSTATPVYALSDGTVTYKQAYRTYSGVKYLTSYGNYIEFTSSNGVYKAKYCHLSSFVGANQIISSSRTKQVSGSTGTYTVATKSVKKGDIIGYIGKTGNASGVHLHFELRKNGSRIDPTTVFSGLK